MLLKLASGAPPCCNVRCGFPLQIRHHNIYLQTNIKSLPFPCNLSCPGISKDSSKMSAPAASRQLSAGRDIPSKRVTVNDPSQLPQDYSTTPGGTLFSTTPGGTRIIYDRHFLLNMRNSPLSQTPPKNLPSIPGVTCPVEGSTAEKPNGEHKVPTSKADASEDQFQMDI